MKRGKGGLCQKDSDGGKVHNNGAANSGNNSRFNPRGDRKDLGNSSKVDAERVKVFGDLEYNQQQPYWDYGMTVGKQICHEFGVDAKSMWQIRPGEFMGV